MIDLHTHVLPGLDDGADDIDEALAMLALAREDGIATVVGTPHFDGADREFPARVAASHAALLAARGEGEHTPAVLAGFELSLTPQLLEWGGAIRSLGLGGGRYLLVELTAGFWPPYLHDILFRLQSLGVRPILAHAERYAAIGRDPALAVDLANRGVLIQVNGDSLLGVGDRSVQRCARALLDRGIVSILASDAHSVRRRPPRLRAAAGVAAGLIGASAAEGLVLGNPAAVVADADLPPTAPLRRRWRVFPFWRARGGP